MLFSISAYSQVSRNFNKNTQPKLEGGIGAVGFNIPNYPGSANNTFRYLPFPWIIYRSDFLQSDEEGTRAKIFSTRKFEIGLSGGLNFPIDSNTNKARDGMPDTDILVGVGPAFIFRIIEVMFFVLMLANISLEFLKVYLLNFIEFHCFFSFVIKNMLIYQSS